MSESSAIEKAAKHHTDLNIFAAVISLLKGGCVYTLSGHMAAANVIALCRKEMKVQLRNYDRCKGRG